jgi:hypothetical protein
MIADRRKKERMREKCSAERFTGKNALRVFVMSATCNPEIPFAPLTQFKSPSPELRMGNRCWMPSALNIDFGQDMNTCLNSSGIYLRHSVGDSLGDSLGGLCHIFLDLCC